MYQAFLMLSPWQQSCEALRELSQDTDVLNCWLNSDLSSLIDQRRHLQEVDKLVKFRLPASPSQIFMETLGSPLSGLHLAHSCLGLLLKNWDGVRVWRSAGWRWSDGGTPGASQLGGKRHADWLIVSARSCTCSLVLRQYSRLEF